MIRQEIKITIERDIEHTVATTLWSLGLAARRNPPVKLWDLSKRESFLSYTEYPGLPDLVWTQREDDHHVRTYAGEVETELTPKKFDKKSLQFKRLGIDDVFFRDLRKCPDRLNWVKMQAWLMDGLP